MKARFSGNRIELAGSLTGTPLSMRLPSNRNIDNSIACFIFYLSFNEISWWNDFHIINDSKLVISGEHKITQEIIVDRDKSFQMVARWSTSERIQRWMFSIEGDVDFYCWINKGREQTSKVFCGTAERKRNGSELRIICEHSQCEWSGWTLYDDWVHKLWMIRE